MISTKTLDIIYYYPNDLHVMDEKMQIGKVTFLKDTLIFIWKTDLQREREMSSMSSTHWFAS